MIYLDLKKIFPNFLLYMIGRIGGSEAKIGMLCYARAAGERKYWKGHTIICFNIPPYPVLAGSTGSIGFVDSNFKWFHLKSIQNSSIS